MYSAPEEVQDMFSDGDGSNQFTGTHVDMWCFGMLAHTLYVGKPPFPPFSKFKEGVNGDERQAKIDYLCAIQIFLGGIPVVFEGKEGIFLQEVEGGLALKPTSTNFEETIRPGIDTLSDAMEKARRKRNESSEQMNELLSFIQKLLLISPMERMNVKEAHLQPFFGKERRVKISSMNDGTFEILQNTRNGGLLAKVGLCASQRTACVHLPRDPQYAVKYTSLDGRVTRGLLHLENGRGDYSLNVEQLLAQFRKNDEAIERVREEFSLIDPELVK